MATILGKEGTIPISQRVVGNWAQILAGIDQMCWREARSVIQSHFWQVVFIYITWFPPAPWRNGIFFLCVLEKHTRYGFFHFFFECSLMFMLFFFSPIAIKSWKEIYLNTVEENRSMLAPWTHTHMWPHVSFSEVLQSPVFLSAHHLIKEEILFAMWKVNPVDVAFVHYLAVTFLDSKIIGFHALENVSGRRSLLKYFPGHSRIVGLEIIPLNCGL